MKRILLVFLLVVGLAYIAGLYHFNSRDPLLKWNWSKIDTSQKSFPKDFVWGVASAAHQVEGGHQDINNFGWWEKQVDENGVSRILNNDKSGLACDHWNRYPEDIQLMKKLGVSSYRFSVSWSKIMPEKDRIDSSALQHYVNLCDSLIAEGITPMVTFHHFTHPLWFHEIGAFEKEENIQYFVDFSELVFNTLKDRVTQWCTINEPGVYMFSAYFAGEFPPGVSDPVLASKVLENLVKSHVAIYKRIKSLPGGDQAQIGIVKNMMQMDPLRKYNIMDQLIKYSADANYNEVLLEVFKSGKFHFNMPTIINYNSTIEEAPNTLDFVGLNYYSHYAFKFTGNLDESLQPLPFPGETMTDMDYGMYPEGIYRAIKRISELGKPIFITENGLADAEDNRRAEFIDKYLYAVSKAIEDGYDVRGYYYWSLMDNFEWHLGFGERFGLYEVNFETQERTLRLGAQKYVDIIDDWKEAH
ncbi:MAG: family 1 glycosylhydrolase [Chitinophagales bacterium]